MKFYKRESDADFESDEAKAEREAGENDDDPADFDNLPGLTAMDDDEKRRVEKVAKRKSVRLVEESAAEKEESREAKNQRREEKRLRLATKAAKAAEGQWKGGWQQMQRQRQWER